MTENAYEKAAQTLVTSPLFAGPLTLAPLAADQPAPEAATRAVSVRFIGSPSSELALALAPGHEVDGVDERIGPADMIRPLLATAADQLGPGTLSEAEVSDARALFADPAAARFLLADADSRPVAWFAARTLGVTAPSAEAADMTGRLSRISTVEMALTVQIGRTRMAVRDVLAIEPGAVIELDRSAGSPADILLNGRLIGHGEIVVVDQDYAVRVTQILDPAEDVA